MSNQSKSKDRAVKVIGIIGAWLTLPVLGLLLIWTTTMLSASLFIESGQVDFAQTGTVMMNGFFGLMILAIIISAAWRSRKKSYFAHLLIGLWIGLGMYGLIFLIGVYINFAFRDNPSSQSICTTAINQYQRGVSAIVPIRTDIGIGSGFIIDEDGTALTAYHVVEDAKSIYASYASGDVAIEVIDTAPEYDVALVKLDTYEGGGYFSISDLYFQGDEVLALGFPDNVFYGGAATLTTGIVSRIIESSDLAASMSDIPEGIEIIQTDAAVNPGSSGGPLIGKCGVIGVVVSVSDSAGLSDYVGAVSEQGIGYAISIKTVVDQFSLEIIHTQ